MYRLDQLPFILITREFIIDIPSRVCLLSLNKLENIKYMPTAKESHLSIVIIRYMLHMDIYSKSNLSLYNPCTVKMYFSNIHWHFKLSFYINILYFYIFIESIFVRGVEFWTRGIDFQTRGVEFQTLDKNSIFMFPH